MTEFQPLNDSDLRPYGSMDDLDAAIALELEEQARRFIDADVEDPTRQSYYMRLDRRVVVKTQEEFLRCQEKGIPLRIISYATAVGLVREEKARSRRDATEKRKKKAANQSRRRNRSK